MNETVADAPSLMPSTPASHPPPRGRIGVLLINLGTPDATDFWSVRRYLKEFLSDPRVIEIPRLVWWPILNLVILTTRPGRTAKKYAAIWDREHNESPLRVITRAQGDKLAARLAGDARIIVDWAMRYGNPSIAARLEALRARGCDRILLVPLYPQYSATSTATACDKAFRALETMRWQPAIRVAPAWHDEPAYITAVAASIREGIGKLDFEPEVVLASFHGLPQVNLLKGDPYYCQCVKSGRLIREALGMSEDRFLTTFQSRFGAQKWLQPYTDATIKALAARGARKIVVVTPGFVADCIETIEEIGIENAHNFIAAGGEKFARIDCLNDERGGMDVIETIVRRELMGWV